MRARSVTFLALSAVVACGGKVVLDGAGAGDGGSSTGGQGGGSAADGGACAGLLAALEAAVQAASACDPDASTDPCKTTVKDGCCVWLASTQGNGVAEADAAYQAALAAGCPQFCPAGCPAMNPMFGHCSPTNSGGRCTE
jgi:hypothetical protein